MRYKLKAYVEDADEADMVRRQTDHFGRAGIEAKAGQTNREVLKAGFVCLQYARLETARRCRHRIHKICGPEIVVKIYRVMPPRWTGKLPRRPLPIIHGSKPTKH